MWESKNKKIFWQVYVCNLAEEVFAVKEAKILPHGYTLLKIGMWCSEQYFYEEELQKTEKNIFRAEKNLANKLITFQISVDNS